MKTFIFILAMLQGISALLEQGAFEVNMTQTENIAVFTKSMYNRTTIAVKIQCNQENPVQIKISWLLRYTMCAQEYLDIDSGPQIAALYFSEPTILKDNLPYFYVKYQQYKEEIKTCGDGHFIMLTDRSEDGYNIRNGTRISLQTKDEKKSLDTDKDAAAKTEGKLRSKRQVGAPGSGSVTAAPMLSTTMWGFDPNSKRNKAVNGTAISTLENTTALVNNETITLENQATDIENNNKTALFEYEDTDIENNNETALFEYMYEYTDIENNNETAIFENEDTDIENNNETALMENEDAYIENNNETALIQSEDTDIENNNETVVFENDDIVFEINNITAENMTIERPNVVVQAISSSESLNQNNNKATKNKTSPGPHKKKHKKIRKLKKLKNLPFQSGKGVKTTALSKGKKVKVKILPKSGGKKIPKKSLLDKGVAKTTPSVTVESDNYGLFKSIDLKKLEQYFFEPEASSVDFHKVTTTWEDGVYLFIIKIDVMEEDSLFDATVDVRMKGPHGGFLSAIEWPLLPFYGVMCVIYVIFGLIWLALSACNWRDLLRIQFWIGGVIFLGMLEKAVIFSEHETINTTGHSVQGAMLFGEIISCLKRTLARMLVIIVSLGFGIVKPRLGPMLHKVLAVGALYFVLSAVEGCFRVLQPKGDQTNKTMLAAIPLAVLDAAICWWIFTGLVNTIRTLRLRRNLIKLSLYRHFTNTLIFAVVASVAFMVWSITQHKFSKCLSDWKELWVDDAFWHLLFSIILMVIMILWRPSANNQRYAFSALHDMADDEAGEPMMNDAFDGMKMRGTKGQNGSPIPKEKSKADEDLKWIDENIPTSITDTALPSLLDSDEEMANTNYEISKME